MIEDPNMFLSFTTALDLDSVDRQASIECVSLVFINNLEFFQVFSHLTHGWNRNLGWS